ncbi:divalent metal cation transporter [candidate division KSB1 bacterium]|nr:divalent metal cation transporter [candidate division KSB1 bacterium]
MNIQTQGMAARFFKWLIGPAAVMTAGIMGAGSTVSLLSSGCYFGYALIWAVAISLPVVVVCQDSASRIGLVSGGKGMMQLIAEQLSPVVKWAIIIPILFTAISANSGQLGAMASAVSNIINIISGREIIATSAPVWVKVLMFLSLAILCFVLNLTGGYKRVERLFSILLLVILISFSIVAIRAFFHWEEVKLMFSGLMPRIPDEVRYLKDGIEKSRSGLVFASAIIGGAVASTAILSFPYFTTEGGYKREDVKSQFKKHVITLGVIFGIYSVILLIAGAFTLHKLPASATFEGASQMSLALKDALGPFSSFLFSIGLFICAYTTLIILAQLATYFVLDALGRDWRFSKDNRLFLIIFSLFIILPAVIGAFWKYPDLLKVVIGMVINTLITPFTLIILIVMMNKNSLMGDSKASATRNLFLAYSLIIGIFTSYMAIRGLWSDFAAIFKF